MLNTLARGKEVPTSRGELIQFRAVDDFLEVPRAEQERRWTASAAACAVADHRHQRDDAGPTGDEEQWRVVGRLPHEVSADRTADLEPVAGLDNVVEERRHLTVLAPSTGRSPRRAGRWPVHAGIDKVRVRTVGVSSRTPATVASCQSIGRTMARQSPL